MVRKGLNIGDTFSDDGRLFRVTQVLGNGDYISEAVTEKQDSSRQSVNPVDPGNRNDSRAVDDPDTAGNQDDPEKEIVPDMDDCLDNQENNRTAEDGSLGDLNAGRYTKRQIQRMPKADTIALAGELGIEISAKTAEIKEAILRNLGL